MTNGQSTREFLLPTGWVAEFHSAYRASGRRLFTGDREAADRLPLGLLESLLKSQAPIPQGELLTEFDRPISLSARSLQSSIESLNLAMGRHFRHRCGYRDRPLLVVSHKHPWATFFSPTSDARADVAKQLSELFEYQKKKPPTDDFSIACIAIIIIVAHPFLDGNGRTARVLLFRMLKRFLRVPEGAAYRYAMKFSDINSRFIFSFWEIRENKNYQPYLELLD
ncbi:hypothetical protein ACVWWJ_003443 [Luteibacter sp. HA06]